MAHAILPSLPHRLTTVDITCFGHTVFGCQNKATIEVNTNGKLTFLCNHCFGGGHSEIKLKASGNHAALAAVPYPLLPLPSQVKYKCIDPNNPYPIRIDYRVNENKTMVHCSTSSIKIVQLHHLDLKSCKFYCVFWVFDYINSERAYSSSSGCCVNQDPIKNFDDAYRLLCEGVLLAMDKGFDVLRMNCPMTDRQIREHCHQVIG